MELIREFSRIGKDDAAIAGGKGASLGEMTQAGIPVPPGYVVLSASFERFLEETDLNVEIDAILGTVNQDQMHTVEHASEHIQKLILEAKMPEDIKVEIMSAFDVLGTEFVAVRSSATAEDSASAAWAGQLDTYLNTTRDMLLEKVQECWASLFTPRAIFYRFEKGLDTHKISVAVVVQKMVNSDAAGIAFSVHPVTEDRNQLIIEAGFGLGEAVVSGQITPDSYVVTKEPRVIIDKNVSEQSQGLFRKEGGGNEWRNTGNGHEQVLSDEQILALSETLIGIEKHYGFPVDTEWAMEGTEIFITQSRPITTLSEDFNSVPSDTLTEESKTPTVLSKIYGREKPLFYFALWQADDKKAIKEYLNEDLAHDLFIVPPPGVSGSIWYSNKEFERLSLLALEKINKSDEFAEALVAYARRYWELLVPYLVEKKRCSTSDEMYTYYQNLVEFWMPMNSIFFMLPDKPGINPIFKEGILAVREITQEYTEEMPRVFSDFFTMRFPEIAHLGYYATPEETVRLDRELEPELLTELERRAKDGCFMFEGSIYPLAMLDTLLGEHGVALEKIEVEGMTRFTGQTAYKGNATGPVCLILSKADAKKMKKGDILVTPMTNPDLVPIMKLAAAIVTDEGGMTCHASIASREMKIPCVVGTKIATQVLKDGDMVEVDADSGTVTVLTESIPVFKKMFTRDTTIIMQELWGSCLTEGIKERFGIDNPNRPAIVHYMNEGSIEIWENGKANAWLMDSILERNNESPNEFADVITRLSGQFDSLAEDWERGCADSVESLQAYIQKARSTLIDFIPYYYSAYDDRTPGLLKEQALTLREKDVFFSSSDTYIRKSLLSLYPYLSGMESAVCIDEITAPPTESVLTERMRHMTLVDGVERRIETLEELSGRLLAVFQAESIVNAGAVLTGQSAYKGIVRGPVRILRRLAQLAEVQEGDILVSPMTTPDFMPAMIKAAAFVTDEGGVTCHAGIVAREMKKPCVIGTKFATQMLKDGDFVEVDAEKGTVTLIEQV